MQHGTDRIAYYAGLPRRRCGSGAIFLDSAGRVLVVEPTYKPAWEIPGGVVEAAESPRQTCLRECAEELGIEPDIGRLLALEHKSEPEPMGDSMMFIYDGGVLPDPTAISLEATELKRFRFVDLGDLGSLVSPRLARRIRYAMDARSTGTMAEIIDGALVPAFAATDALREQRATPRES